MLSDYITTQFKMPKVGIRTPQPPGLFDDPTNVLLVAILVVVVIGVGVLIFRSNQRKSGE